VIRRARPAVTGVAAFATVAVVAVGLLTSCSEDDSARRPVNPAPSVAVATTTTSTTAAAVGPTTTIAATSSLVVIEPTTSATAATVTTTAATPVSVVDVASELVLLPVGVGTARFGAEADGVIAYISRYIGPPTADSGWIDALESPFGVCSGERVRGLQWGQLQLLFGDESSVSSTPGHFFSYRYGGFTDQPPVPAGLRTDSGLMLGSTLAQIRAAHPEATVFEDPIFGAGFSISQGGISGTLTDGSDAGQVKVLYGGIGCGE
jgi:hypothetical protein